MSEKTALLPQRAIRGEDSATIDVRDASGGWQKLHVVRTNFDVTDLEGLARFGPGHWRFIPGLIEFWTARGKKVERLAKGRYRVCQTGEELTSNDPEAP